MNRTIRFLLGRELVQVTGEPATLTLLQYLRARKQRTGTKEGCAEGDCGACTVVIGEMEGGELRHRAVNACLLLLPQVDGKQVLTVEDLGSAGGGLHPVQQAMVASHAAQCGFCTPGFVMSVYALWRAGAGAEEETLKDALAGNLCRCTGYRPILEAARAALAVPPAARTDDVAGGESETRAALTALGREGGLAFEHDGGRFFAPRTLAELFDVLEQAPDAVLLAGGTDLGLAVTKQHRRFPVLVHLGAIAELRRVTVGDRAIEIGAGVSIGRAAALLAEAHPPLDAYLRRFGGLQVRNTGTLGGNIANASPIGDSMPALIALGASVVLASAKGERILPLEDFFLDYRRTALGRGEIVRAVQVPRRSGWHIAAYKVAKRYDQDISAIAAGFALRIEGGRVAEARLCYGGMAATPKRAATAEAALAGQPWGRPAAAAAMAALERDFSPIGDARASRLYRRQVARNLIWRFYLELQSGDRAA